MSTTGPIGFLNLTSSLFHTLSYLIMLSTAENNNTIVQQPSPALVTTTRGNENTRSLVHHPLPSPITLLLGGNNSDGSESRLMRGSQPQETSSDGSRAFIPPYDIPNKHDIPYIYQYQDDTPIAALNLFKKILPKIFNNDTLSSNLYPKGREVNYYDGETIATVQIDSRGKPIRCNLIEVNTEEEQKMALDKFARDKRPVEKASFRVVLGIITACGSLDPNILPPSKNNENIPQNHQNRQNYFTSQLTHEQRSTMSDPNNIWSVASGILPGTKWCGLGDIAKGYNDLGQERKLDKCCRAHDYCPIKVKSFRRNYGLVNWSLYTKSHCQCDLLLYNCLKNSATSTADVLGNVYFNVIRIQCIDEEDPMKCVQRDQISQKCQAWQPMSGQPKKLMFRNVFRDF